MGKTVGCILSLQYDVKKRSRCLICGFVFVITLTNFCPADNSALYESEFLSLVWFKTTHRILHSHLSSIHNLLFYLFLCPLTCEKNPPKCSVGIRDTNKPRVCCSANVPMFKFLSDAVTHERKRKTFEDILSKKLSNPWKLRKAAFWSSGIEGNGSADQLSFLSLVYSSDYRGSCWPFCASDSVKAESSLHAEEQRGGLSQDACAAKPPFWTPARGKFTDEMWHRPRNAISSFHICEMDETRFLILQPWCQWEYVTALHRGSECRWSKCARI